MIIPVYEVGQNVHLKPFPSGADGIRCVCNPDKKSDANPFPITAPELGACWHGVGTRILRVFPDGYLLLENRHGFVRGARPDEVCR